MQRAAGCAHAVLALATLAAWMPAAGAESRSCDLPRWIDSTEPFCVHLPSTAPLAGLRVYLGRADVSLFFRLTDDRRLEYRPSSVPLPPGEQELVVRARGSNGWVDVERRAVNILSARRFERATRDTSLELGIESRPDAGARGDASPNEREAFTDVSGRAALGFELARAGWLWALDSAVVGSTYRNESLRYAELDARAPRIDLSHYRMSLARGGSQLIAGHVPVGRHPLLLQEFDGRGVVWRQRFGPVADLSLASVNGSTIVGYDNLLGLDDSSHRIDSVTAGFDLLRRRPGALRLELSWLHGSLRPIADFGAGEITDRERSEGYGARLTGNLLDERMRADVAFARSRYVNPFDETLAQGGDLVPVRPTTQSALTADLRWIILQAADDADATPLDLGFSVRFDRADPLYRSIGSSLRADNEHGRVGLDLRWRALSVAASSQRQSNNLDDIPTILKSRTTTHSVTTELDFRSAFEDRPAAGYVPAVTLRHLRQQEIALNTPDSFQPTHRPDQLNRESAVGLRWTTAHWEGGVELADIGQDNRQPGRALADYRHLAQTLSIRYAPNEALTVGLGGTRTRDHDYELGQSRYHHGGWLALQWALSERWRFVSNGSIDRDFDSLAATGERTVTLQSELAADYDLRQFGASLPLQFFLRHSLARGTRIDGRFDLRSASREWQVIAGFNLSFR